MTVFALLLLVNFTSTNVKKVLQKLKGLTVALRQFFNDLCQQESTFSEFLIYYHLLNLKNMCKSQIKQE